MHSTLKDEVLWRDEFHAELFFSNSSSSSFRDFIAIHKANKDTVKKNISDTKGRLLILDVEIAAEIFPCRNIYVPNKEYKQIKKIEKLFSHIKLLNLHGCSQYVCTGDLNNFFNCQLEGLVENPSLSQIIREQIL